MRRAAALALATCLLVGCSDDEPETTTSTTTTTTPPSPSDSTGTTIPAAVPILDNIALGLEEVAELDEPIALAARPGSPDLYIAEKGGRVRLVKVTTEDASDETDEEEITYELQNTPLLDISDDVINEGERGLLGMSFSTDGRKLYLDYTRVPDGSTVVV